ncbi:UDP-N-acetylmuramoyl-L-alanine--D-glutamate ligase [Wenzhouxiangella limi]|uniref:UDP-N-acetylmuramoylalanine--D-glutamate ligase n=1 Tax=Wenzhouxiangella limi TaxID=2707351 RepID=A0A845V0Z1_9GAMM|nr:UDP-N-acetylmuramoyl-L-alanine--D-glutamate ligase [Wenzhouxiangella limi]NDY96738.1 UDP-N-acetylmuramoyl-L-alanine--D-glutamate ligase [Wenzhouxiangella limi]
MRLEQLRGLRIGILGYGREGAAALDALLARVPDCKPVVWVESGAVPVKVPSRTGPFDHGLLDFDVLIRSPGIPVLHPALQHFRSVGGPIVNPTSIWLAERPDVRVLAVTGSKGKSTTASLLAHMLHACGRTVLLAGNIGVPVLEHLDTDAEMAVLELSSYQLADLEGRLHLGLFTRLFPEHGDWHGGVDHYFASKLRMVELLHGLPLLINARDPVLLEATELVPARVLGNQPPLTHRRDSALVRDGQTLLQSAQWPLLGQHNLDNAALALEAAARVGVDLQEGVAALRTFRPLAHRLEVVAGKDQGRGWINDSIATTPHATLAALEALQGRPVVLIAGGYVRPADWSVVLQHCRRWPLAGLVVLPDSGCDIAAAFVAEPETCRGEIRSVSNLDEAVAESASLAGTKGTILLSPGAASFPHFRNFEDRGERFREAVRTYRERSTA